MTNTDVPVVGNGTALGLTDGKNNVALTNTMGSYPRFSGANSGYGKKVGVSNEGDQTLTQYLNMGVVTNANNSGLIAKLSQDTINTPVSIIKY